MYRSVKEEKEGERSTEMERETGRLGRWAILSHDSVQRGHDSKFIPT